LLVSEYEIYLKIDRTWNF